MIKAMINSILVEENVIEQAYSYAEAKELILKNQYDILFLDITLPRGNTFELLEDLPPEKKAHSEIIFLTGHDTKEYFLNAIKHSASGYVLKPIDLEELKAAIHKSQVNLRKSKVLSEAAIESNIIEDHVPIILVRGTVSVISVHEISHLIGEGSMTTVFLNNEDPLSSVKNVGHYKDLLVDKYGFLVISKSTLVNPSFIEVYKHSLLEITLKNGIKMNCSRRGGRKLKDWLTKME